MSRSLTKPHVPTNILAILTASALVTLIAGCGGGGGGGSSVKSQSGALAPNVIFYSNSPDGGITTVLNQVNPDGTGKAVLGTLPANYQGISMNPAVKNERVFGYSPSGTTPPTYGLYQNTTISPTGATQIVAPTYSFIESMQVSFDGAWVYFVASVGSGDPELYKVAITGGTPLVLDNSGFIYSANVDVVTGSMITYDKETTYSNGNIKSAIYLLSTAGTGTPTLLANDPNDNYEFPQFSKDATRIACESDKDDPNFEIYTLSSSGGSVNGSNLIQVTNMPTIGKQDGVSLSADGTVTAFIGQGSGSSQSGVYRSGVIGVSPPAAATLIVQDATVEAGLYWTSTGGRAQGGTTAYLAKRRHNGLIP